MLQEWTASIFIHAWLQNRKIDYNARYTAKRINFVRLSGCAKQSFSAEKTTYDLPAKKYDN